MHEIFFCGGSLGRSVKLQQRFDTKKSPLTSFLSMPWFLMKTKPTVVKAECSSCTASHPSSPSERDNTSAMSTTGIDMLSVSYPLKLFCFAIFSFEDRLPWFSHSPGRRPAFKLSRAQLSRAQQLSRARAFTANIKIGGVLCVHVLLVLSPCPGRRARGGHETNQCLQPKYIA